MNINSRAVHRYGIVGASFFAGLLALALMVLSTTASADAPVPSSNADQDRIIKEMEAKEKAPVPEAKPAARPEPAPVVSHAVSQWYVGASVGRAKYDLSAADLDAAFASAGITSSTSIDDHDTAYKAYVGWQFHKNFGIELGYADLGKFDVNSTITAPVASTVNADASVDGFALSVVGTLPVTDNFSVIGRLGAYFWNVDGAGVVNVGATAVNLNLDDSGTSALYGIGAQYDFTKNLGARAEYEVYSDVSGDDIDFLSAGIVFRF